MKIKAERRDQSKKRRIKKIRKDYINTEENDFKHTKRNKKRLWNT